MQRQNPNQKRSSWPQGSGEGRGWAPGPAESHAPITVPLTVLSNCISSLREFPSHRREKGKGHSLAFLSAPTCPDNPPPTSSIPETRLSGGGGRRVWKAAASAAQHLIQPAGQKARASGLCQEDSCCAPPGSHIRPPSPSPGPFLLPACSHRYLPPTPGLFLLSGLFLRSQPFLLLTNSLPLPISPSPLQSLSLGLSLSLSLSQSLFLCLSIRSSRGIGTGVFPTIVQSVSNRCSCRRNSNLPTAARTGVKFRGTGSFPVASALFSD